jgi:hypothetical protein
MYGRWGNGPGLPSKQDALATARLMARCARLAWKAGGRRVHHSLSSRSSPLLVEVPTDTA